MKINEQGVALIRARETLRLNAYKPTTADEWTIGWGHTGPEVHDGLAITAAEAEAIFTADLLKYDGAVSRVCPQATSGQHSAMVCLAFNIGIAAFGRSSVCRLHNAGRYAEAAQAFALWNKQGKKVLGGLVTRRAQEAALYLSDAPERLDVRTVAYGENPIAASRTITGSTIGGAAAAASAVAELSQQVDDWKDTVRELSTYFEAAKWALLALVVLGIAITLYARYSDRSEGRS